jgi:acyl carrier protein
MNDIRQKLAELLTILLGQKISEDSNVSMENCREWDSMKHIEIISTIEDEMNISFPIERIPKLISFDLLAKEIEQIK